MGWSVVKADALDFLRSQADGSADLVFTSPPYLHARTYGIAAGRDLEDWTAWMVTIVRECVRVCKGLTAVVCEGQTRDFRYLPAPFLLAADLHRAGFNLRKPPVFHRVGIPGSGGPDWLRNDYEPVICVTPPGKLPWSDNTACGHPPKWGPGGEMSHRLSSGKKVNQWGPPGSKKGGGSRFAHGKNQWGHSVESGATVVDEGGVVRSKGKRPSHREHTKRMPNGEMREQGYVVPVKANPGNVLEFVVGGGCMGHKAAHDNEAPFPLKLAEFFVQSFAKPAGRVLDPFTGSGTTCHAAVMHGREFAGCDIRESQVKLCTRRMETVTKSLFAAVG